MFAQPYKWSVRTHQLGVCPQQQTLKMSGMIGYLSFMTLSYLVSMFVL